jgi:hypothetical protein
MAIRRSPRNEPDCPVHGHLRDSRTRSFQTFCFATGEGQLPRVVLIGVNLSSDGQGGDRPLLTPSGHAHSLVI